MNSIEQIITYYKNDKLEAAEQLLKVNCLEIKDSPLSLQEDLATLYYTLGQQAYKDKDNQKIQEYYELYTQLSFINTPIIHIPFTQLYYSDASWKTAFDEINQKSLEGLHQEAIQGCLALSHESESFAKNELYGWIIWRFITAEMNSAHPNVKGINEGLNLYTELSMPKPSLLHSTLLTTVLNLLRKIDFHAYKFMYHWGWSNFRPEDLMEKNDNMTPSLFEISIVNYARQLLIMFEKYQYKEVVYKQLSKDLSNFMPLLEGAIDEFSINSDMPTLYRRLLSY